METSYSINLFYILPTTIWTDIYRRKTRYRNVEALYNLNSETRDTLLYMIKFDLLKLFHGIVYNSGHVEIGTLEDGSTEFLKVGTPIPIDAANMDGKSVIQVSAGKKYSLFLCEDGSAYASGIGKYGRLGVGNDGSYSHNEGTPIPIDTSIMKDKRDPELITRADMSDRVSLRVIQVSAGNFHSLFLCEDGSVFASGFGWFGRLGDGRIDYHSEFTPIPINTANMKGKRVIQVSAGSRHSLFLCDDGSVYSSGNGYRGKLGDGRTDDHSEGTPIPIDTANMERKKVIQVSAGEYHSLFLCEDGSVYSSGYGQSGVLGDGRKDDHWEGTPIPIDTSNMGEKIVIQVSAGQFHSLFLCEDGSVYASGIGGYGQLGDGRTDPHNERTPIQINTANMNKKRVIQVSAGNHHSLFLCEDGTVFASGNGRDGELGDGRTANHFEGTPIPIDMANMDGKRVIQVSANDKHSLFLT